ncbi:transposase [Sphingobacterium siyangense]|uniref:transposase n=1 Tax=Sphingobacterium siyangense TaxID=459529 RepID=UPI003DA570AC
MIKVRRKYDRIFKERAVELSKNRKNLSELARELGISAAQLYKWRKESEEFVHIPMMLTPFRAY